VDHRRRRWTARSSSWRKKSAEVEKLQQRLADGEALEKLQHDKIAKLDELREKLAEQQQQQQEERALELQTAQAELAKAERERLERERPSERLQPKRGKDGRREERRDEDKLGQARNAIMGELGSSIGSGCGSGRCGNTGGCGDMGSMVPMQISFGPGPQPMHTMPVQAGALGAMLGAMVGPSMAPMSLGTCRAGGAMLPGQCGGGFDEMPCGGGMLAAPMGLPIGRTPLRKPGRGQLFVPLSERQSQDLANGGGGGGGGGGGPESNFRTSLRSALGMMPQQDITFVPSSVGDGAKEGWMPQGFNPQGGANGELAEGVNGSTNFGMSLGQPQFMSMEGQTLGVDLPPADSEDRWQSCWEWVNTGWCPRGETCRWEHPQNGGIDDGSLSGFVQPFQMWAGMEEGGGMSVDWQSMEQMDGRGMQGGPMLGGPGGPMLGGGPMGQEGSVMQMMGQFSALGIPLQMQDGSGGMGMQVGMPMQDCQQNCHEDFSGTPRNRD